MKTIEELKFDNVILIEKYLSHQLSEEEVKEFMSRLQSDMDMQDDYELLKDYFMDNGHVVKDLPLSKKAKPSFAPIKEQDRLKKKIELGQTLISNSFYLLLAMLLVVFTCVFVLLILK